MNHLKTSFSSVELKDMTLLLGIATAVLHLLYPRAELVYAIIALLGVGIVQPRWLWPLAFLWFGLAFVMSKAVVPLVMGTIYILLVCPVGLLRRLLGNDAMMLRDWKVSQDSILKTRNLKYSQRDLKHPY